MDEFPKLRVHPEDPNLLCNFSCHCFHTLAPTLSHSYLYERLSHVPRVTVYGPSPSSASGKRRGRASLSAFNVEGLHATDVSTMLVRELEEGK